MQSTMLTDTYTTRTMARQKSDEIKSTDGRRHNKRLPSKVKIKGQVTSQPAKMNAAKKKQLPMIAEKVAIKTLGGAAGIFEQLAEIIKSGESDSVKLNAIKMYLDHLEKGEQSAPTGRTAPTINFSFNQQPDEKTIDIESKEVDEE